MLENSANEKDAVNAMAKQSFSTPIHMSAYSGSFDVLKLFVDKGGKVLQPNRAGDCLLHISIRLSHTDYSKKVIALVQAARFKGNAFDIENVQEKLTPYMLAVLREQFTIADLLVSAQLANPNY